jgi:hypothetical protein
MYLRKKLFLLSLLIGSAGLTKLHATPVISVDLAGWESLSESWTTIDFEGIAPGPLNPNQYLPEGVTFTGTPGPTVVNAGDGFQHSGSQYFRTSAVLNGGGGSFLATFSQPVSGVSFFTHGAQLNGSTVTFFDANQAEIGSFDLLLSGFGHGTIDIGFNGYFGAGIAAMRVQVNEGDAVRFDDLRFGVANGAVAVPDATPVGYLCVLSFLALAASCRRMNRATRKGSLAGVLPV